MKQRVISAVGMFAILVLMFTSLIWTPYVFDIFVGVMIIIASIEMSNILQKMGYYNYTLVVGIFPSLMYALSLILILKKVEIIVIFATMLLLIICVTFLTYIFSLLFKKWLITDMKVRKINSTYSQFAFRKSIYTLLGMVYPTLFMIFLIFINHLSGFDYCLSKVSNFKDINLGLIVLLIAFIIPTINDIFAMLFGMLFKGPKLCPKISPKKTISGFVSGVCMTTFAMVGLYFILTSFGVIQTAFNQSGIKLIEFAMLGFFGAIVSTIGDLLESCFKRKARVKDSGNLIPGHGGILDRIDSHIMNASFVFFFFFILLL